MKNSSAFWPNGARLVISVSMQFEAGAQPERGAESPFPVIDTKYPDLPVVKVVRLWIQRRNPAHVGYV